jgi:hypothetical protein
MLHSLHEAPKLADVAQLRRITMSVSILTQVDRLPRFIIADIGIPMSGGEIAVPAAGPQP